MTFGFRWKHLALASALALGALSAAPVASRADDQFFPLQSYRVGPYAAGGSGFFGGFIDYMNLINMRDGGVNGVKLTWDEGETQYEVERGVEVYERLKSRPAVAAWNPLSVGIAYAMIDRITQDKTPLITVNHGRTDSTDGRVFPYVFPLLLNPYSETSGIVKYISSQIGSGGLDNLKGKKIVVLYLARPTARRRSRSMSCSLRSTPSKCSRSRFRILASSSSPSGSRFGAPIQTMSSCAAGA
jgi:branched-chain amino acid transport system substrate-binding protein